MKNRILKLSSKFTALTIGAGIAALLSGAASDLRAADYPTTVSNLHPLVYYRLNDVAAPTPTDGATNLSSLGAGANGYYVGTSGTTFIHPVTTGLTGSMDAAASFTGGYVETPFLASFNQNRFAVEMWFNMVAGTGGAICSSINFDGRYGWIVYYNEDGSDVVSFRGYNGTGSGHWTIATSTPVPDSTWHHLVAQSDGTNASLYVDGVFCGSNAVTPSTYIPPPTNHPCPFVIFSRSDGGYTSQGTGGQVAVYTNALTFTQITNHYAVGLTTNPSPSYQTVVLKEDGALAYWPLDDGAFVAPDPSTYPVAVSSGTLGTAANGTYLPGTTPGAAGPGYAGMTGGGACHFNGLGSAAGPATPGYIDISAAGGIDSVSITTNITMMAWIQVDTWLNEYQAILGKGDASWRMARGPSGGNGADIQLGLNDISANTPFFGIAGGLVNITDSLWHQVVGVYDGETVSLYIDGVLDSSASEPGHTINSTSDLASIGEDTGAPGRVWDGNIAEVAIFTNALNADQVSQVYSSAQIPPIIVQEPQGPTNTIYEGSTVDLDVLVHGSAPLAYQWTQNGHSLAGQTSTNLVLTEVTGAANDGTYTVIVTNLYGAVTSAPQVVLTIVAGPPYITGQPAALNPLFAGGDVTYSVRAGGSLPLFYQWYFNGVAIAGATNSIYANPDIGTNVAGLYTVLVSNSLGFLYSVTNSLSVIVPTNYDAAIMSLNPFAYWLLNETSGTNAFDSAAGHTGAIMGTMVPTLGGPDAAAGFNAWPADTHAAYLFNGKTTSDGSYVDCGLNTLDVSNNVAVAAWIQFSGTQNGYAAIVTKGDDSWRAALHGSNPWIEWDCDGIYGTSYLEGTTFDTVDGNWHLMVASYLNGEMVLYEDGSPVVAGARSTPPFNGNAISYDSGNDVEIGNNGQGGYGTSRTWSGQMANVALFTHGLTADQVAGLWTAATNTVQSPTVEVPPVSQTVYVGQPAAFGVMASGLSALTYQWQFNSNDIPGATRQSYAIATAAYTNAGSYSCLVSNSFGKTSSPAAILTVDAAPAFANLTNGLILHLKFDGDLTDSSGNGNNAFAGGSPTFIPGRIGSGAIHVSVTNGSNPAYNYAYVSDNSMFANALASDFSVSYWVRMAAGSENNDLPILGNGTGSTYQIGFSLTEDRGLTEWSFCYALDNNYNRIADPVPNSPQINDGNWHQIVVTLSVTNDVINTFADGVWIDSEPLGALGSLDTGNNLYIGQDAPGTYGADGQAVAAYDIDDMGIWDRALSPVEAESIYAAGQNGQSFDSAVVTLPLHIAQSAAKVVITWTDGTLMSSSNVNGPWTPVAGASPPSYTLTPGSGHQFYILAASGQR